MASGDTFDDSFTEYYSFLESGVYNAGVNQYFDWVKKINPMAVVLAYVTPKCETVFDVTKCFLIKPDTLHYEAVAGASNVSQRISIPFINKSITNYKIDFWDGNNVYNPESTGLTQVQGGCMRQATYSVCTKFKIAFSTNPNDYCGLWESRVMCELNYTFPAGISKAMRFTTDNLDVDNKNVPWTFVLGYFGLNKR